MESVKIALPLLAVVLLGGQVCLGTIALTAKRQCPVCEKQIGLATVMSCGGYIYDWDSKYDLVYWPFTEPDFVWTCPNCGYAQISKYFDDVGSKEKERLREFLADKWKPIPRDQISTETRIEQAILVNKFLKKDDNFWAWFNRILIHHYRQADPEKAKTLAKAEIELLERKKGKFTAPDKNRLYLLGEYSRMTGNEDAARKHFQAARKVDLVSETKDVIVLAVVLDIFLLVVLVVLWVKRVSSLKLRILCTCTVLLGVLLCSTAIYLAPQVLDRQAFMNQYFNGIIDGRLKLLANEIQQ
jgi:hypothetical protein